MDSWLALASGIMALSLSVAMLPGAPKACVLGAQHTHAGCMQYVLPAHWITPMQKTRPWQMTHYCNTNTCKVSRIIPTLTGKLHGKSYLGVDLGPT